MSRLRRFGSGAWRGSPPTFLRVYLLVGAVLLAVALLLYFHRLSRRVDDQAETMNGLVARVIAFTTLTVGESPDSLTQTQFQEVLQELPFPVVLTDVNGRPLTWSRQVPVEPMSIEALLAESLDAPGPELGKVLRVLARMDRTHRAVPMIEPGTRDTLMYLHYGSPALAGELKWTPWITIGVAAVFGFTALLMLRSLKRATEGYIWAGMAKETAHQMGTPLSSLSGWLEVLREETGSGAGAGNVMLSRELFEEVVGEMERDAGRLGRVAARFSQIGSRPRLEAQSPVPVVQSTVDYFRKRAPEGVTLTLEVGPGVPDCAVNPELLGWVLENLLKNAMSAMETRTGRVEVLVQGANGGKNAAITVRDNGKGVEPGMEKQIFRPGVSTRMRGWGLGLPLSRRIVEQYHGGRLDLVRSAPGEGAEFRVLLPCA